MPCDYSKYPANWFTEIRPRILARADNRCERCGLENHAYVVRGEGASILFSSKEKCDVLLALTIANGLKCTKIVLTIAHVGETKHDKMDCRDEVLLALCQRCHLLEDMDEHKRNRSGHKYRAAETEGQTSFIEVNDGTSSD